MNCSHGLRRPALAACLLGALVVPPAAAANATEFEAEVQRLTAPGFCRIAASQVAPSLDEATALYRTNRPRAAAAAFAAIASSAAGSAGRLEAMTWQARALKVLACNEEARQVLAAAMRESDGDDRLAAARCHARGRLARLAYMRNVDSADAMAAQTIACAVPNGPSDSASEAHTTRALVALTRSDYAAAGVELQLAFERAASPLARSEARRTEGSLLGRRETDSAVARRAFTLSADEATESGDPEAQALALIAAGYARPPATRDDEATDALVASGMKLALDGELRRAVAVESHLRGLRLLERQTAAATTAAAQSLGVAASLYAAIDEPTQERALRLELGRAALLLGDYPAAQTSTLRARVLALAAGLAREAAKTDMTLGTIARLADPPDLPLAHALLVRALSALRASGDEPADVAGALSELAAVEMAQGGTEAALGSLADALALALPSGDAAQLGRLYASYGWTSWQAGLAAQAHAAWRFAVESPTPQAQALGWWGLARELAPAAPRVAAGRYANALAQVERMRPQAGEVDASARGAFDRRFSELYREYAALLVDLQEYAQAHRVTLLLQRQELVEMRWAGTRAANDAFLVSSDNELPVADACNDPAMREAEVQLRTLWAEQGRLRSREREACCSDAGDAPSATPACAADPAQSRYCPLRNAVRREQLALYRRQGDCVDQVREAAARAGREEMEFAFRDRFLDGWINATLDAPVYLVVTIVEDQRLHVLVRAPGERTYRGATRQVSRQHLQAMADALRNGWDDAARQNKQLEGPRRERALAEAEARLRSTVLREFHELLFGGFGSPVLPDPPAAGTVIAFVLDRVLREAPMAALHDGRSYLGERFGTVLVTPGSTTARPAVRSSNEALVMGVSKPNLPFVEGEVAQVAKALGTTAYLNEQSTRARVVDWLATLGPGHGGLVLHFASHASMGGSKASSQVRLWGEDRLTGIDLDELRDSLRRVELVVFSACHSAGSSADLALGLAGVAERGARSVIGSLWAVDDASTGRLMSAFYSAWRRDPAAGVAQALATAQRDVMRKQVHPYFWAPFGVVGRWD